MNHDACSVGGPVFLSGDLSGGTLAEQGTQERVSTWKRMNSVTLKRPSAGHTQNRVRETLAQQGERLQRSQRSFLVCARGLSSPPYVA